MLAVQTNALAVQSSPPLPLFTGEDLETEANSFDRWLDRFEERATILAWLEKQKCCHIKQLLSRTASQIFDLLLVETRTSYATLVTALKTRFKPVDIEELRGLELHQLMQTDQTVEKLGLQFMQLAKKAFPSLEESIAALYEQARVCERHDQQYQRPSKESCESSNKARKILALISNKNNQKYPLKVHTNL